MANTHKPLSTTSSMYSNRTRITKMPTSISVFAILNWENIKKVQKQQKKHYLLIPTILSATID